MSAQLLLPSSSLNDLENCTQPSADSPDGDGTCSLSSTEERRPSQLHCAFCLGSSFLDESLGALIVAKADLARRRLSCYAMLLLLDKFNAEESASATGGTNLQEHPVPAGVQEGKSVNETKILKPPLDFHAAAVRLAGPFLLEKYTALFRDWFVRHRISRQLAELSRQPRSAASDNGSKVISERENQKPRDEGSERRESPGAAQAEASVPQSCRPTVLENSNPRPSAAAEEKSEVAKRRVTKFEVERGSPEAAKTLSKEEGTAADMAQSRSSASSIPVEPLKEPKVLAPPVCSEAHPDRHHLHHHYQHQEDSALPRRRLTASAAPSPNFNLRQSPSSPRRGRSTRSGGYLAALPSTTEGGAVAGSPSACCYFHPNGLQLAANARRQLLKFLEKHSDRRSAEARRRQATVASTLEAFWIRFGESPVSTPKAFFEKGGLQPALSLEAPLKNGSGDKGVGARIPNPPLSVWEFALLKTLREKQRSAGASLCSEEDLVHVASGGGPSSEESLEASLRKASSERLCHHAEPLGLDQVGDVAELFAALQNLQRTLHTEDSECERRLPRNGGGQKGGVEEGLGLRFCAGLFPAEFGSDVSFACSYDWDWEEGADLAGADFSAQKKRRRVTGARGFGDEEPLDLLGPLLPPGGDRENREFPVLSFSSISQRETDAQSVALSPLTSLDEASSQEASPPRVNSASFFSSQKSQGLSRQPSSDGQEEAPSLSLSESLSL